MQIQILGAVALAHGDRRIGVAARQVRTLLALLALSPGTPVPFDRLVEELWAGKVMGNARNALQANVVRLRKLLEGVVDRPGDELMELLHYDFMMRALAGALIIGVTAPALGIYLVQGLPSNDMRFWVVMLLVQSLPYVAALIMAFLSSLPKPAAEVEVAPAV